MSSAQFQPGFRVGRYELLAPIASGGMASVWAARMRGTRGFEKLVAIKTILPHLASDPQFETMFLDEAWIASEIVHPNIAQVFDLGEQDGVLYLVCEWIDGESLAMLRRRVEQAGEQIPVPVALRIMADVCAGLHAAHELRDSAGQALQVVHRDVSPQNVLISDAGAIKVIDFGVAKALNRAMGETVAGKLKGKVQYMAPEQARGGHIDRRADLWSVGAVLYHLLAGRVPYEAEAPLAVLNMLLSEQPPPPLPRHVPVAVSDIVMRALTHDPANRYQTAAEMQIAIVMALRDVSMPVTDAAVADYVRKYLGPQSAHRHDVVSAALEAAKVAATLPPDLTLVEYVTRIEGKVTSRSELARGETTQDQGAEGSYDMPTLRPPPPPELEEPDLEPVPLVRRSKADWEEGVPGVTQGLQELRSMVQQTMPEDAARDTTTSPSESVPVPSRAKSAPRAIAAVAAVVLIAASAVFAWTSLRDQQPPTRAGNAPPAASAASVSAPPATSPASANKPAAAALASSVAPMQSATATPPSASVPVVPPQPPKRHRPGSDVPPPPPGWESLPSVTEDPDDEEVKAPVEGKRDDSVADGE